MMSMVRNQPAWRVVAILATLFACTAAVGVAYAMPGPTACAAIEALGLETLPDGTRVDPGASETERRQFADVARAARSRIADMFGGVRAKPILAFLKSRRALFPFSYNAFGSTQFVGGRTCVLIGPRGTNTDVVAHELMHAELADRVGAWQRWWSIPVWFDEGVAMQLDTRPAYDLHSIAPTAEPRQVRDLNSAGAFFVADDRALTLHYALAKAEVASWLAKVGPGSLFDRLHRIHNGEAFQAVVER